MVEVTDEDRRAAERWGTGPVYNMQHLAEAFARHRIAAEQRSKLEGARLAIEAAIREADEHARLAWKIGERQGQSSICSSGRNYGARAVGQSLRALSPAKIVNSEP